MPDLDELRRLREQATPGPWRQRNVAINQVFAPFDDGLVGPGGERVVCTVNARSDEWDWRADARLIVAAVNALPGLLTELAHLRSRVAELETLAGDSHDVMKHLRSSLTEAREVVRPFAIGVGKDGAVHVAHPNDHRRAAEWLRRQDE